MRSQKIAELYIPYQQDGNGSSSVRVQRLKSFGNILETEDGRTEKIIYKQILGDSRTQGSKED